ncbi:MAG: class I SAM-dependent methyltransferase [Pyrinomonadaceae bacterium]
MGDWDKYVAADFPLEFPKGSRVLDVGCGDGNQMRELARESCSLLGIDIDTPSLVKCRNAGLDVIRAAAEKIPVADASLDGIVCKVVLPYTREHEAIAEFGRVLKPGGKVYLIGHGAGYYLNYLLLSRSLALRFYGFRSLMNTWCLNVSGYHLPRFLGDTIYQSRKRLNKHTAAANLTLHQDIDSPKFLGFPVFIYETLAKGTPAAETQAMVPPAARMSAT